MDNDIQFQLRHYRKCYLENKYNQVSLISVEFLGVEYENDFDYNFSNINNMANNKEISNTHKYNDEELDEICLNKLKEIKITLDLCVKKENINIALLLFIFGTVAGLLLDAFKVVL